MNRKAAIFFIIMLVVISATLTAYFISKRIPMDPDNSGNIPGNMQNSGLFFEMDGKVYFSNASDYGCLYSMNPDETKAKRLTTMGAKYISGADGFLYFYMDSTKKSANVSGLGAATNQFGIYRCKINGDDQTCLVRDFCGEVQLCGEYLYYQLKTGDGSLHKIKCNKKDGAAVADEPISPVCFDNGIIYYTGVRNDHAIHAMYTQNGDNEVSILPGSNFFPVVQDGYIYYLDGLDNYKIYRASLSSGEKELITSDRVDCFTMDRNYIYYSCSDSGSSAMGLHRCDINGANNYLLYQGVVNSINVTSRYIYFKEFGNDEIMLHMPIDLSRQAEVFIVSSK